MKPNATCEFLPVNSTLFFKPLDPKDPRLGEWAVALAEVRTKEDLLAQLGDGQNEWVIAGYPDHEGIRLNGGRPGARSAPDTIRRHFYRLTPPAFSNEIIKYYDVGNVSLEAPLETRHENAKKFSLAALQSGCRWLAVGGGHDYGYADAAAFVQYCIQQSVRPLVLNFDAHLDVRPLNHGLTSGTPFFRLLSEFSKDIDFAEIGIQRHCNSRAHVAWALEHGAQVLGLEEIRSANQPFHTTVWERLKPWMKAKRPVMLSLDMDMFHSEAAPGCSQSWNLGVDPFEFLPLLDQIQRQMDVRSVGIYEVSPPLDVDDRTSKLAALIMHRLFFPV